MPSILIDAAIQRIHEAKKATETASFALSCAIDPSMEQLVGASSAVVELDSAVVELHAALATLIEDGYGPAMEARRATHGMHPSLAADIIAFDELDRATGEGRR